VTPMTEQHAVTKSITVEAPQQRAFEVFASMTGWWPVDSHHIGNADVAEVVMEPRAGGRWYERGVDGVETDWGQVLAWDPFDRMLLGWQLNADWAYDPELLTELEVTFTPQGDATTLVTLEHRNLDRYREREQELAAAFDSEGGWTGLLTRFAEAAKVA
jgi:Activator of Hsp90 ATPase homolog 1-like protein